MKNLITSKKYSRKIYVLCISSCYCNGYFSRSKFIYVVLFHINLLAENLNIWNVFIGINLLCTQWRLNRVNELWSVLLECLVQSYKCFITKTSLLSGIISFLFLYKKQICISYIKIQMQLFFYTFNCYFALNLSKNKNYL